MENISRRAFLLVSGAIAVSTYSRYTRDEGRGGGRTGPRARKQVAPLLESWGPFADAPTVRFGRKPVYGIPSSPEASAAPSSSWATSPKPERSLNVKAAVQYLDDHAAAEPQGQCAAYVRRALEAGGLIINPHPRFAKDWGPYLLENGFQPLSRERYAPLIGDVVVIQPHNDGGSAGHIAMFDGKRWVSDFWQRDIWSGPDYREHKPSYRVYRS